MTEYQIGAEDGTLGPTWSSLDPQKGDVLEVHMPSTNLEDPGDFWAAFLVFDKRILSDGSMLVQVRCMGSEGVDLFQSLQRRMNITGGYLHLCVLSPCVITEDVEEMADAIHVTKLRRWEFVDFISAEYLSRSMRTQSRGWYAELMGLERGRDGGAPARRLKRERGGPGAGRGRARGETPRGRGGKPAGLTEAAKSKLKERLREVRNRTLGIGAVREPVMISDGEEEDEGESYDEDSCSVPDHGRKARDSEPFPPIPPLAIADLRVKKEPKERKKTKKKEKKRREKSHAPIDEEWAKVVATSEGTSRSWRRQLVDKAVLASKKRESERKRKGRKKESKSKAMKNALSLILTGGSKKDKKDRKRRSKKRKVRSDGVIESFSESSESTTSEEEESCSSETDLDTPMKKRSRDAPGSVLAMLTNHVKEQLDQGATTELPDHGSALTSGTQEALYNLNNFT